ncbi:MAG: DUF4296 domain-containing protein [Bacteroidales bacterium]|nr:DUF4296 domain-containing protein [Bacteroidales bacterium]
MKRLAVLFLAILTLCTSCHKKQVVAEKPANLIGRKQMVEILTESYLAEAFVYASLDSVTLEENQELTAAFYNDIYNRHNVTKQQFITSIEYYVSDKELIQKMLDEVLVNIQQQKMNSNLPDSLLYRPLESILHRDTIPADSASIDSINNTTPGIDI